MSFAVTIRTPVSITNISSDYINNNNENERHKEKRHSHNNRFPKNNRQQSYPKRYNTDKGYHQYDCCNYSDEKQHDYRYTSMNKIPTTIYDNKNIKYDEYNGDSPLGNEISTAPTAPFTGVTDASLDVAFDKLNFEENPLLHNKFSNSAPCVFYTTFNCAMWNSKNKYRAKSREIKSHNADAINRRIFGLMERFGSRSHIFRLLSDNKSILDGSMYDNISQPIWDIYQTHAQNETIYLKKLDLWKMVYMQISRRLDKFGLYLVGSTMSGLGMENSDIDMCLLVRQLHGDARLNALYYLQGIHNELLQSSFIASSRVIQAKVPILKFRDSVYGFEVDLNCNNSVGIRNTHLLNCYGRLDWRVRPMVVVVKLWAQQNNINDAKCMTVSSYSLALMVIHYLQCGVKPPVIPCLHGLYPQRFNSHQDIPGIDITEELPPFHSDNTQSLGELFLGLLRYYAQFDYDNFAISVREGCKLPKEECRFARSVKNDIGQWKLLCIEEPFDRSNTARSVYDPIIFDRVKKVFRDSYDRLLMTHNLYSLFGVGINGLYPNEQQLIINNEQ